MVEVIIGAASQIVSAPLELMGEEEFDRPSRVAELKDKAAHLQPRGPLSEPHPQVDSYGQERHQ